MKPNLRLVTTVWNLPIEPKVKPLLLSEGKWKTRSGLSVTVIFDHSRELFKGVIGAGYYPIRPQVGWHGDCFWELSGRSTSSVVDDIVETWNDWQERRRNSNV